MNLLGDVQNQMPGDDSLKQEIKDYKDKHPVLLQQMVYFTGKNLKNGGQEKDNLQNMQENIVLLENNRDYYTFENVYKLKGEYQKITGNCHLSDEVKPLQVFLRFMVLKNFFFQQK